MQAAPLNNKHRNVYIDARFQGLHSEDSGITDIINQRHRHTMRGLSLFANIGIAEAYLHRLGFNVVVANELDPRRATIYKSIYPSTNMICGDITDKDIYKSIIDASKKSKVDFILATPPCQGMSTAGKLDKMI